MIEKKKYVVRKRLSLLANLFLMGLFVHIGFDWYTVLAVFVLGHLLWSVLCKKLVASYELEPSQSSYRVPLFQVVSIIWAVVVCLLLNIGHYQQKVPYSYWLFHTTVNNNLVFEYEILTMLVLCYVCTVGIGYGASIKKMIEEKVDYWFPRYWGLILAIEMMFFTRGGFNHITKLISLLICAASLILTLLTKRAKGKQNKIAYVINSKKYLLSLIAISTFIWLISMAMPVINELPGTRWLMSIGANWGIKKDLLNEIPYEIQLSRDVNLSEAILFEVEASEPVCLRDMAYSHYEDNTWHIEKSENSYMSYIKLKPNYLEAEYNQTSVLLSEIAWIRSKEEGAFKRYSDLLSNETNTIMKRQLTISQNPINKINYFTVNGFFDIKGERGSKLYYYGGLNNLYFHSEKLMEPTDYRISYYKREPKPGSREYDFLRDIDHYDFLRLYTDLQEYRSKGIYNKELIPTTLQTYTPLVQYNNAKKEYLQLPKELEGEVRKLARNIVGNLHSDWDKAEALCNYLKENYTYNLDSKFSEKEDMVYDFLFNQKQGICQDFASSMVLMCRSIDLPARYVTGYRVSEKRTNTNNTYIVREKDAHAFVEVYIPAYGWMQFDPTPSVAIAVSNKVELVNTKGDSSNLMLVLGLLFFGGVLLIKGSNYVHALYWYIILHSKRSTWAVEELMRKTLKCLVRQGYPKEEKETISQYAYRMMTEGKNIGAIVSCFEKQTFGGISLEKEEVEAAYTTYKNLKKGTSFLKK